MKREGRKTAKAKKYIEKRDRKDGFAFGKEANE